MFTRFLTFVGEKFAQEGEIDAERRKRQVATRLLLDSLKIWFC